ncbi:sulfatase-like hydrolase/transferase [Muricauda sp. SCSIO 64092]|uniref:sulfatase-like hydrolase/transferase n=1 Tax=Allomuricauda sp. SCSIO 64092 TaxID=2908842 RepID=UPI001FF23269|nr:sulfatase-like hydrolase/transferase [Muricauda sp. SCSIO 64092]UOY08054.1 sulfatase-like hydrolase/transferase [Muricauda sp. SCSIO 64092]
MFRIFLSYLFLASFVLGCSQAEKERPMPPNVVFIFLDDLGYGDLSCYGNDKIVTPNFDALAKNGIKFTQFYSNAPVCSPSRVAFITGQYPFRRRIHGVVGSTKNNKARRQANFLDTIGPLLPKMLKNNGYATAHFGKWHMGGGRDIGNVPYPTDYGYDQSLVGFEGIGDRILDLEDHALSNRSAKLGKGRIARIPKRDITRIYVDSALSFIKRNKDRPFYVNIFPGDVHDPFKPTESEIKGFRPIARDEEEAKFFAVLKETDKQVGRFVQGLESMGLIDDTIIIMSSDNGPTDWPRYYKHNGQPPSSQGNLRGRKWSLYEGGIRVPLLVQWKGHLPENSVDSTTVGAVMDLFPTIMNLTDSNFKEVAPNLDGIPLDGAIYGTSQSRKEPIFWYFPNQPVPGNPEFMTPKLAMRYADWKFLVNEDGTGAELYNLKHDPKESSNIAQDHMERVEIFTKEILDWYEQTVVFVN